MTEAEIEVMQLQAKEWQATTESWEVGMEQILPQSL